MFIDIHVHPDFFYLINEDDSRIELRRDSLNIRKNGVASVEHINNQMNCASLDKLCIFANSFMCSDGNFAVSNEEIKRIVDSAPDKFIGFASINPLHINSLEILEHAFKNLSLRGLKLHPGRDKYYPHDERLNDIYKLCLKYDRPIMFHSGLSWEKNCFSKFSHPLEFEEVAAKYPNLRICLAHFGWPWVRETAMLMLKYQNIYADTAALYFDDAQTFFKRTFTEEISYTWIDRSLRHQVMFGSNNPRFEQIRMARAIENLGFRDSTVDLIKGKNALVFLGESYD